MKDFVWRGCPKALFPTLDQFTAQICSYIYKIVTDLPYICLPLNHKIVGEE